MIEHLGTIYEISNSLSPIVDGPLLGLFVSGMFFPWIGKKGIVFGIIAGLATMTLIVAGNQWHILNNHIHFSTLPTSTDKCPYPLNKTLTTTTTTPVPTSFVPDDEPWIIFKLSFLFLVFVGMFVTVVVALISSLIIGESSETMKNIDPRHVAPCVKRFGLSYIYSETNLCNNNFQITFRFLSEKKKYIEVPLKEVAPFEKK